MAELLRPPEEETTMKFLKLRLLLIAAVGFAFSGTANAQATQNIDVSATVPNFCIFDGTSDTTMAFDLSTVATAVADFTDSTVLAWRCSTGFNTTIGIGPGGSGDQLDRELDDGGATLAYNLYIDNTYGTIWGDGTAPTSMVAVVGTGMGNLGTSEVFGRILLADAQAAEPGTYTDTVIVGILP
jgi:spore coat protein U-like protein